MKNMDMKKILSALSLAVLGLGLVACTDELDGVKKLGSLDTDDFYANATDDEALQLITAVYDLSKDAAPGSTSLSGELLSTGQSIYGGASTQTADMTDNFGDLYQMNYMCNMIIEKMPENTSAKQRIMGEAYFWRAWAFMNLIRGWGNPPLVDHVLSSGELEPGNGGTEELWDYVYKSLDEAITRLPSKSGADGQQALGARVTKEAAEAVYGKAAVLAGDMATARTQLSKVINSNLYGLIDDFGDLYTTKADWCKEYLWEYNAEDSDYDFRSTESNYTTSDVWRNTLILAPGGPHIAGDYEGYIDSFAGKDYYNFFVEHGEKGLPRQLGSIWNLDDVMDAFGQYEGVSGHDAYLKFFLNYSTEGVDNCQGYFQVKEYMWGSDLYTSSAGTITSTKDVYFKTNRPGMRYAEVLLLYAEACLGSGDAASGLAALNEVRTRAGLAALSSYDLSDLQDEVKAELYAENGEWFWNCVRWGIASTEFANVGKCTYKLVVTDKVNDKFEVTETPYGGYTGWMDKYELIPYPYTEMNLNANLTQNPGWD